ncbi:MAG: SDR family NAD(P)-dependent oxidoreductase [Bacteroidetes bacterium]|nr:SDR family NAD(P)-dependent oxidoreductase [Bacteroidota bacterium]
MSIIFLTGGTGNLGKTVVNSLLEAGHSLHLTVRHEEEKVDSRAGKYTTDLTNKDAVDSTIQSIIVSNQTINTGVFLAGGYTDGGTDKVTIEDVHKMMLLNFETAFHASLLLLNQFRKSGGGKLIFIGAKAAMDNKTAAGNVAYALSKQMLFSFCNMINENENRYNISAHILLPNTLDTELNRSLMPDADFTKWTKPSDIASTINNIIIGREQETVIHFK